MKKWYALYVFLYVCEFVIWLDCFVGHSCPGGFCPNLVPCHWHAALLPRENENIDDILSCYKDDNIINRIAANSPWVDVFNFSSVTAKEVHNLLENMYKRKATGYDNIPPKILKVADDELAFPITNLINLSIEASCFPSNLKKSELSPLLKAKDSLLSENDRPLSTLPSISKLFEKVFNQQLYEYFTHILSDHLSACRKKYGCQHVLT